MMKPLVLALLFIVSSLAGKIDDIYNKCDGVSREELEKCVIKTIDEFRPLVKNGLFNLGVDPKELPFDPVDFDEDDGINHLKARYDAGVVRGLEEFEVTFLKLDYKKKDATWAIYVPELFMTSDYYMDSNIMYFELFGNGTSSLRFEEIHIYGESKMEVIKIEGKNRLQQSDADITFSYSSAKMKLTNMYNGQEEKRKAAVAFLEENVDAVIDQMRPSMRKIFKQIISNVVNKALSKIDINNIAGNKFIKEAFDITE